MTRRRSPRKVLPKEKALDILHEESAAKLDPEPVALLEDLVYEDAL